MFCRWIYVCAQWWDKDSKKQIVGEDGFNGVYEMKKCFEDILKLTEYRYLYSKLLCVIVILWLIYYTEVK